MLDEDDECVQGVFRSQPRQTDEVGCVESTSIKQGRGHSLKVNRYHFGFVTPRSLYASSGRVPGR